MEQQSLFHYTSFATFINFILPSKELKFSKYGNATDPYEYKTAVHLGVNFDRLRGKDHRPFYKEIEDLKNSQRLCFSSQVNPQRRAYAKPRMWEQYGNNHDGVCIELNKSIFEQNLFTVLKERNWDPEKLQSRVVKYRNISSKINWDISHEYLKSTQAPQVSEFLKTHLDDLFFSKDFDYRDENEYRYFYPRSESDKKDIFVPVSDSVINLYFGDKVSRNAIECFKTLICSFFPNTKIVILDWINGGCGSVYL